MSLIPHKMSKTVTVIGAVIALLLLMLYMTGFFRSGVIQPGQVQDRQAAQAPPQATAFARLENIAQTYEAVGTIRSATEANIVSQVAGRILSVMARPGDRVAAGAPLIKLDDRDFQARLEQARHALRAAQAGRQQAANALAAAQAGSREANAHYQRINTYYAQQAATRQDLERAEAAQQQAAAGVEQARNAVAAAEAGVEQARKVVEEAEITLGYTTISAPQAGQIADRRVDPGDTAFPGKPLLILQSTDYLRLEANVREGLIGKLQPGAQLPVKIDAVNAEVTGTVEEIVPLGDPASRAFVVKVRLPPLTDVYAGMFGRLLTPLAERPAVLIPQAALRRIGQMEVVRVEREGRWVDLYVKAGRSVDGKVEILSGLAGNEKLALWTDRHE